MPARMVFLSSPASSPFVTFSKYVINLSNINITRAQVCQHWGRAQLALFQGAIRLPVGRAAAGPGRGHAERLHSRQRASRGNGRSFGPAPLLPGSAISIVGTRLGRGHSGQLKACQCQARRTRSNQSLSQSHPMCIIGQYLLEGF